MYIYIPYKCMCSIIPLHYEGTPCMKHKVTLLTSPNLQTVKRYFTIVPSV